MFRVFHILALLCSISVLGGTRSVTISWGPSGDPTAIGTFVYWGVITNGTAQQVAKIDVGPAMTNRVTGLDAGNTYFFYVTAYNSSGIESIPSNKVEFRPLYTPVDTPLAIDLLTLTTNASASAFTLTNQEPTQAGSMSGGRPVDIYTPPSGFIGKVGMEYTFDEGLADVTLALVSILVGTNAPTADTMRVPKMQTKRVHVGTIVVP